MDIFDSTNNEFIEHIKGTKITERIKVHWQKIHSNTSVFRYNIDNKERVVDKKYLLQLNPNRSTNRRPPEEIVNICQQFDENKFNFSKVSIEEIIFKFKILNDDNIHTLIVNVSPISLYHTLLCPSLERHLPQIVTKQSLKLVIELMLLSEDRDLRIGFNSLCALASVNHLHYHLFFETNSLPVETVKCKNIKGGLYCCEDYPVCAFCFQITKKSQKIDEIYRLLELLIQKSISHNILLTRGDVIETDCLEDNEMSFRFLIFPRKPTSGAKSLAAFNIGVCELSGWFIMHNAEDFYSLETEVLETELKKCYIENFENLCEELKTL